MNDFKAKKRSISPPLNTNAPAKPLTRHLPISPVYPVIDTDLARDNLENDLSEADRQDV